MSVSLQNKKESNTILSLILFFILFPTPLRVFSECQKDGVLGTLIMGPAGEIICLSFWDPLSDTVDHPAVEHAMREHGNQVSYWLLPSSHRKVNTGV